ncbi:hypothetical protein M9H77_27234 [Catharanthus roseus]|uniref:Uncharacterized protein n=1 Tax=Catharanthus roseus TaxID=4058 RepID=A0ACC0AG15_CATRO|nr:hypothetical protein M9H77_27234 [Catharanthus roseus]
MDKTGRVQGRTVTASFGGVRGRHSTSDPPSTHTLLLLVFIMIQVALGSSTQPPYASFRSPPPLPSHLSHTPVPYEAYGSVHPPSHLHPQCMIPTYMLLLYVLIYHIDLQLRSL